MAVEIWEKFGSRAQKVGGQNPNVILKYIVRGTTDDTVVRATVQGFAPATYSDLIWQDYDAEQIGPDLWEASVNYGPKQPNSPEAKETGDILYSFDTGGGTQHITQSKGTVDVYGDDAPDCQGAIGVNEDTVDGCDIVLPVFNFQYTIYVPTASVTGPYKQALFALTGTVNDAPFDGLEAGEVLFMGASGSKRGKEDWELTFKFQGSINATGLTIGEITGINKKGWEHLWVRYQDHVSENQLVRRPTNVYIEQVYDYGDFSALGLGI